MNPPVRLSAGLLVLAALAMACESPSPQACGGDELLLREEGVLRVGVDMDFAPFAFRDDEGGSTGFEIELLREISERMDLDLLLLPRGASALVPGVMAHSLDLAASGIRDDPDLVGDVCASGPYLEAGLGVLAPVPDPREIGRVRDLAGRTVAVWQGSRAEAWVRENLPASAVVDLPALDDLLAALDDRSANAAVADLAYARFVAAASPSVRVVDEIDLGRSYVLVAAPDNGPLTAAVDAVLEDLEDEGWLEGLRRHWFEGG